MQYRIKKDKVSRGKIKMVLDNQKRWVAYTENSKVWKHLHGRDELDVQMYLALNGFKYKVDYRS